MAKARRKKQRYERVRYDSGQHHRILAVMAVLGLLAFLPGALRLYQLMVVQYDYYAGLASRNQSRTTPVAANRGVIYDTNMNILACGSSVENVYLAPNELKQAGEDISAVSQALAQILDMDAGTIEKKAADRSMRYQQIAANVEPAVAERIRAYIQQQDVVGIHLEPSTKRYYPYGSLAAQVIGFTNASGAGSEGIEASYNRFLEGTVGKVVTSKGNNDMDMPFSYEYFVEGTPGCDVVLTLDITVQQCLEKRMEEAISKYDVQNGAFGLVMDAKTGEILAMATLGSYDPNQYLEIYDEETAWTVEQLRQSYLALPKGSIQYDKAYTAYRNALQNAQLKQWRNRVLSDGYEPGSTFKVLTMAAALDSGAITLNNTFYCRGAEQIPGRSQLLHCWRSAGHGSETTAQAIQNSCNIAFAHIALDMGGETFYEYIKNFGVLEKTGIDLAGEAKGVFFDRSLIVDTAKWGTASLTSASFGQTFKLTPLQLARAIACVVNGGYLMEPYLVSEVLDANGNTVLKQESTVIRQVISEETSAIMRTLLESVVTEGTAKNAAVAGYSIGGKTGTSEKIDVLDENGKPTLDKIVSFVGVAPMDDPQYIVLVALDTPSRDTGLYISGGVMAAPTVGAVFSDILPYLGVEKQNDDGQVQMPDLTDLSAKEAEKRLKEKGLTCMIVGSGQTVTGQIPAADQTLPAGSQVLVYMGSQVEKNTVTVPDFSKMTRQQASDTAGLLGLYILATGNPDITPNVVVTGQSIPPGTEVAVGTTIKLTFTDTQARD
ncbi:MAG: PASTA domain-containing protein [Ruminococcaceae bacterium]|nr:PASTA domain-containing protein [Oscillospiraceae bacterium]